MTASLKGKHVLVVEDEYFIAAELVRGLTAIGAIIVGPAANAVDGLDLADEAAIDGATARRHGCDRGPGKRC